MIYLFTGNSDYLVNEQIKSWKTQFLTKLGDFNLLHLKDLSLTSNSFLLENLTSTTFFAEKKLIIIEGLPLSSSEKNTQLKAKQDFLETILENIPEENIVLFSSINPDKRSKFYKKLKSLGELKEFNIKDDYEIVNIISKKYPNKISKEAINLIIKYKSGNLSKIFSELEKLFISYDVIDKKDISENIIPELEESVFQFIDDLLNLKIKEVFDKLEIILEQTNVYAFYNNLLANLKVQVFIKKLKSTSNLNEKNNVNNLSDILGLGNRAFLLNKSYKIDSRSLQKLYIGLVDLDKKMKTGNMIGSEEEVFITEIEKEILKIKS